MSLCVLGYKYKECDPVYVPWHEDPSGDGPACYDPCEARLFYSFADAERWLSQWWNMDGMFVLPLTPEQEADVVARALAAT